MPLKRPLHVARLFLVLLLLVIVAGCAGGPFRSWTPAPVPLTILFFNDPHGHLTPFEIKAENGRQQAGGIAGMAALIRDIRAENDRKNVRTLVLVAGDILQGTPLSTVFRGEPDVACLNAMGVDAVTVGNHEFDFGMENFRALQRRATFPFLSANIVEKRSGRPLFQPFLTLPLQDDLAVTVIGATTWDLLTIAQADPMTVLDVIDPVSSVRQVHDQIRSRGPAILLSHNRHRIDREIAADVPHLAAIIGGHDHVLLSPYRQVGPVPIFQTLEKGLYLGRIDFLIDAVSKKADMVYHSYIPITAATAPEPKVAAIVAAYQEQLGSRFREVIGRADTFLDGEPARLRSGETALGNFIADLMVEQTGAQVALLNAGSLRAGIPRGAVTVEDIFKAMPYANELVVMELTGTEIGQALARAVSGSSGDDDGGFLQVSGLAFEVRGRFVENIRVGPNRRPLEPGTLYRVAMSDFLAMGGDRYTFFKGKPQLKTGLPLRDLIVDTIRRRGVVTAREEGRILRLE